VGLEAVILNRKRNSSKNYFLCT